MAKRVSITVINDLATDQRLYRMAASLQKAGYHVHVTGRKLHGSPQVGDPPYSYRRLRLIFRKGPLFYAIYNARLFFILLSGKYDLLVAIDLDTLLPNHLVSRLRGIPVLYDCHEYFTEVPELIGRPGVRGIWKRIEKRIVPRLNYAMAVSEAVSQSYSQMYGTEFITVRNLAPRRDIPPLPGLVDQYGGKRKIMYQGALNIGRGIELMIDAMAWMEDSVLLLAGDGDIAGELKVRVHSSGLSDCVVFTGRLLPAELHGMTPQCDLGLSLEEDRGLNYRFALPNKIFDYIQARIPVLCSDLPEMSALVKKYDIGEICTDRDPRVVARQISELLGNRERLRQLKVNLERAASELCWENEEKKLLDLVERAVRKKKD